MGGLAATRQRGSHSFGTPCRLLLSFYQSSMVSWISSRSIFLSLTLFHLICLNPLIPKPLYICLPASPSSSLTLLPPNHSHHSLVKRWGKQALVFDRQVLSADISLRSTLSVWPSLAELSGSLLFLAVLFASGSLQSSVCLCVCV